MDELIIPDGFLSFSDAVNRLAQGIWGGKRRPAPVQAVKRKYRTLRIGFGPWKQQAGELLTAAGTKGHLPLYLFARLDPNPVLVPVEVLARMIRVRGALPDHAIRASMKTACGDARILKLLNDGILLVRTKEFSGWYRSERAKGKWPSQRSSLKRRQGRPSKQCDALRSVVINTLRDHKVTVAELRRRLLTLGLTEVPSRDTLRRLVDQLYQETGESVLRWNKRTRRRPR